MDDHLSRQCPHCGSEISPAASVCGFCQKPVTSSWIFRPITHGLIIGLCLSLLTVGVFELRRIWLSAQSGQKASPLPYLQPAATPATIPDPDRQYQELLGQAANAAAQSSYRTAVSILLQAITLQPERPEARSQLERLREELMRDHRVAMIHPPPIAPLPAPPVPLQQAGMARIPAGHFVMGASGPGGQPDEYPPHEVTLGPYLIDIQETTTALYREFCTKTKRPFPRQPAWSTPRHPVVSVTWHDAQACCRWAGKRLPTEAEWEHAAKGISPSRYFYGDSDADLGTYAWFADNSGGQTHPIGEKPPGGYGLFDTYGNVWEWVSDWYSVDYYESSPKRDPRGPSKGEEKVLRGGAFDSPAKTLTDSFRDKFSPNYGDENRGFRCAKSQKK